VIVLAMVIFPEAVLILMPVPATKDLRTPFEALIKLVPVPADVSVVMP
jgi:hypothetical protein